MAFEGAISSLGASRGIDGSIDRVPDPPQALWNKLAFLSAKCETENIEILSIFEVRDHDCSHLAVDLAASIVLLSSYWYFAPAGVRRRPPWNDEERVSIMAAQQHE